MFEKACKEKYRFESVKGDIMLEDLYDLPLISQNKMSLNEIAKTISKQLKEDGEENFVNVQTKKNTTLETKLAIVKHVIEVKKLEAAERLSIAENKAKKEKLMNLIVSKENEALSELPLEELRKMVSEL